jgi:hypothetical protein
MNANLDHFPKYVDEHKVPHYWQINTESQDRTVGIVYSFGKKVVTRRPSSRYKTGNE